MESQKIIAIVGSNGSGKTKYVDQLRKDLSSSKVRYIAFCDTYGTATDRAYYLQLRWNQHDIDKETPCVGEMIQRAYDMLGDDTPERRQLLQDLISLFEFEPLLDKYTISLSSGELRKFQLIKTLLAQPGILILDTYVDDIIWITPQDEFLAPLHHLDDARREAIRTLHQEQQATAGEVVSFHDVSIRYGERTILKDVNWTIREGECWALSGQNGSGKSTLLSLICADNPQAYACDIRLFGKQRGSGETIWDIKRRIGYVSPEMHRSYQHNIPAIQVVASGLKDTVGLYTRTNEAEREQCRWWMRIFGIDAMEQRPFLQLSSGEQRRVLLARAFVKAPQLLILDEPLHGLDSQNRQLVKDIIQTYSELPGKTLIMVTHYEEELPECFTLRKQLIKQQ